MQAQRHINFDERALFYGCATYSRQIEEKSFTEPTWYYRLKPVIALQVLDYDTNRIRGIQGEEISEDHFVSKVKAYPLPEGEFIKHFELKCKNSGQVIDHLQLIQIELGRAEKIKSLYPPQGDFTSQEWWLSVLKHAGKYTQIEINSFAEQGIIMPEEIKKAFGRLQYSKWSPREMKEMKTDIIDREGNALLLAAERAEGKEEGIAEGEKAKTLEIARNLLSLSLSIDVIGQATGLSKEEIMQLQQEMEQQGNAHASSAPGSMDVDLSRSKPSEEE